MSHTIRLRGHWEASATGSGLFRWLRRFGRPTGGDNIVLRITAATYPCRVSVNEGPIRDVAGPADELVIADLRPRNVLVVDHGADVSPEAVLELRDQEPAAP